MKIYLKVSLVYIMLFFLAALLFIINGLILGSLSTIDFILKIVLILFHIVFYINIKNLAQNNKIGVCTNDNVVRCIMCNKKGKAYKFFFIKTDSINGFYECPNCYVESLV